MRATTTARFVWHGCAWPWPLGTDSYLLKTDQWATSSGSDAWRSGGWMERVRGSSCQSRSCRPLQASSFSSSSRSLRKCRLAKAMGQIAQLCKSHNCAGRIGKKGGATYLPARDLLTHRPCTSAEVYHGRCTFIACRRQAGRVPAAHLGAPPVGLEPEQDRIGAGRHPGSCLAVDAPHVRGWRLRGTAPPRSTGRRTSSLGRAAHSPARITPPRRQSPWLEGRALNPQTYRRADAREFSVRYRLGRVEMRNLCCREIPELRQKPRVIIGCLQHSGLA